MRLHKRLLGQAVEVDERAAHVVVYMYQRYQRVYAAFLVQHVGIHVQMQRRRVAVARLHHSHGRGLQGGREGVVRAREARIRLVGMAYRVAEEPAVRRCRQLPAVGKHLAVREHARRNGQAVLGRAAALAGLHEAVAYAHRPLVSQRVRRAKALDVLHHQAHGLGVFPVAIQRTEQLVPSDSAFVHYALFYGRKRVRHGGKAYAVDVQVEYVHSALRAVQPPLHAAVHERVHDHLGAILVLAFIVYVIAALDAVHYHLRMVGKSLEQAFQRPLALVQVFQRVLERVGQIGARHVLQRVLAARYDRPVAAHLLAHAAQLLRIAVGREALLGTHAQRVAHAAAVLHGVLKRTPEQLLIHAVVHAQRDVARYAQHVHRFQYQEGHVAGDVAASVRRETCYLRIMRVVEEQAGDVPNHLVVGDYAGLHVALIPGAEQLVQLIQRAAQEVDAVHRLIMRDELAGLTQGARRVLNQPLVHIGYLAQVPSLLLGFGQRLHCAGLRRQAGDPLLHADYVLQLAVIERGIGGSIELAVVLQLPAQAAPAQSKAYVHVRRAVVHACPARICIVLLPYFPELRRNQLLVKAHLHEGIHRAVPRARQRACRVDVRRYLVHVLAQRLAYVYRAAQRAVLGIHWVCEIEIRVVDKAVIVRVVLAEVLQLYAVYLHLVIVQALDALYHALVTQNSCLHKQPPRPQPMRAFMPRSVKYAK